MGADREAAWLLGKSCVHVIPPQVRKIRRRCAQAEAGVWSLRPWPPPRSACMFGKRKDFADDVGLCSPGRWARGGADV